MKTALLIAAAALLAGCGTTPPRVVMQRVYVEVPIACPEKAPDRPVMPTEHLPEGVGTDAWVQAGQAEIERREAYEIELRAALANCTKPITQATAAPP